jgi:hypothetical protein
MRMRVLSSLVLLLIEYHNSNMLDYEYIGPITLAACLYLPVHPCPDRNDAYHRELDPTIIVSLGLN